MSDSQRETLIGIAQLVTIGKLYEYAARTEELTSLPNRRDMRSQLEAEFSRYQRSGQHFSVILLDIDHFKTINDNYGHDAGDIVLYQAKLRGRNIVVSQIGEENLHHQTAESVGADVQEENQQ